MLRTGQILGSYRIEAMLGRGAMGVVYRGIGINDGQTVAIKTVRADLLAGTEREAILTRFRQEAYIGMRLRHPRIVRVHDYGEQDQILYLVMEWIAGEELGRLLERQPNLPLTMRLALLLQLLHALAYAHAQGVIHRDLKPANILVRKDYTIMLSDFGIAHIDGSELTQLGDLLGSPLYMAPEQLRGELLDPRADLFAVGVVLYVLLTRQKPFAAGSLATLMQRILHEEPSLPSTIDQRLSPVFDAIVQRALAKDRVQRFADAHEFAAALRQARTATLEATVVVPGRRLPKAIDPSAETTPDAAIPPTDLDVLTAQIESQMRDCLAERTTSRRLEQIARTLENWFALTERAEVFDSPEWRRLQDLCTGESLTALVARIQEDAPLPGRPSRAARGDWLELIRLFVQIHNAGRRLEAVHVADMARTRIIQQLTAAFLQYAQTLNPLLFRDDNPQLLQISADFMRLDVLQLALVELGANAEERYVQQMLLLFANQVMTKVNAMIRQFLNHHDPVAGFGVASLLVEIEELIVLAERLIEGNEAAAEETAGWGGTIVAEFVDHVDKLNQKIAQELILKVQSETHSVTRDTEDREQSLFNGQLRQMGLLYRLATCLEARAPDATLRRLAADTHRFLNELTDHLLAIARTSIDSEQSQVREWPWTRLSIIAELAERFGWPELHQRVLLAIRERAVTGEAKR